MLYQDDDHTISVITLQYLRGNLLLCNNSVVSRRRSHNQCYYTSISPWQPRVAVLDQTSENRGLKVYASLQESEVAKSK